MVRKIQRIAILGAGNGGCAAAADLTARGFEVRLQGRSLDRLAALSEGITLTGRKQLTASPALLTTDIEEAVKYADLVMLVVPSHAHEAYARALAPVLEPGMLVLLNPGHTGGALNVARAIASSGGPSVVIGETVELSYICRMEGPATVGVYRETENLRFAALPARETTAAIEVLRPVFPNLRPAANVLETGLMNMNAVIHPAGMVMNAGWVESTGGDFFFYRDAITPSVARAIESVDRERLDVAARFGLSLPAFIDYFYQAGLTTEAARASRSVHRAMRESGPNRTIKAPKSLDHRYVHEDVGYGLVPLAALARIARVPTPSMNALVALASIAQGYDYAMHGLTIERMGLNNLTIDAVVAVVRDGR
jgi:opine dehydrogenase